MTSPWIDGYESARRAFPHGAGGCARLLIERRAGHDWLDRFSFRDGAEDWLEDARAASKPPPVPHREPENTP